MASTLCHSLLQHTFFQLLLCYVKNILLNSISFLIYCIIKAKLKYYFSTEHFDKLSINLLSKLYQGSSAHNHIIKITGTVILYFTTMPTFYKSWHHLLADLFLQFHHPPMCIGGFAIANIVEHGFYLWSHCPSIYIKNHIVFFIAQFFYKRNGGGCTCSKYFS